MIISMILLPCFVAYFLHLEYKDEKNTMELEKKDEAFNKFFGQIDNVSDSTGGGLVSWIRNDSGANVSFELKVTSSNEDDCNLDTTPIQLKEDDFQKDSIVTVFTELRNVKKNAHLDDWHLNPSAESYFNQEKDSLGHRYSKFPTSNSSSLEIYRFEDSDDTPVFGVVKEEINFSQVLSRILPQILFSAFLLLSVFLAYWLIFKSLRKERQLALIRNDFMSNMSHELKTPVSTIGVALEALSTFDAAENPELRKEYIDISRYEVERLGLLVDKALNISLYEQGKFVFDRQSIDLKNEIERVLKTLKVQLDNQQVELEFQSKGMDFIVNVDRTHMVNVIYNLIENGIKYSEKSAEIDIRLIERSHDVEISIADKGRGIAPEFQDRVFDKFFRVPQGHTHNVKGHGLGLSYVREVVESMGGKISLKSGIDAGSTFIIKIPKTND